MRKTVLLLITLLLSCGKQPEGNTDQTDSAKQATVSIPADSSLATPSETTPSSDIAAIPEEFLKIPEGVYLDSTREFVEAHGLDLEMILPKSRDGRFAWADDLLTYAVRSEYNSWVIDMSELMPDDGTSGNSYRIDPSSIYIDSLMISYCLFRMTFINGTAHPSTNYFAYNYNINSKRPITFSDYFSVTTSADSASMLDKINAALESGGLYYKLPNIRKIDFNIDATTVTFNFEDHQGTVDKEQVLDFIKSPYKAVKPVKNDE